MIEHVSTWAEGDIAQGKVMLIAGGIVLLATFFAWKSGGEMLRGMLIPLGLIVLICAGYGGFMQSQRAGVVMEVRRQYEIDQAGAKDAEVTRIRKDCNNYRMMNYIWSVLVLLGVLLLFMTASATWKGAALGVILLAAAGFLIDNFLHQRAEVYLEALLS